MSTMLDPAVDGGGAPPWSECDCNDVKKVRADVVIYVDSYGSNSGFSSVRRKASKRAELAFGQSVWHAHRLSPSAHLGMKKGVRLG